MTPPAAPRRLFDVHKPGACKVSEIGTHLEILEGALDGCLACFAQFSPRNGDRYTVGADVFVVERFRGAATGTLVLRWLGVPGGP